MSEGVFTYWRFRSARPQFEPGAVLRVYLTAFDPVSGRAEARIGDTVLEVTGADARHFDQLVDLRVESFDATRARGQAVLQA